MQNQLLTPELEYQLSGCQNLPSPPIFALRILEIANDPNADMDDITKIISLDPVISSKILRIANSPLYAHQKKIENLKLAILVLGLNATVTLSLSFSLTSSLSAQQAHSLDHSLYWRRSGLCAAASQAIGKTCEVKELEELFMATLLQDMGMLVLDQAFPGFYDSLTFPQENHSEILLYEHEKIGVNHAHIGSWLLGQWNLSERLQLSVASSDDFRTLPLDHEHFQFVRCVALSGAIASLFLGEGKDEDFNTLLEEGDSTLDLHPDQLTEILDHTQVLLPEIETLFDLEILKNVHPERILDRARETMLVRSLQTCQEVEALKGTTADLEHQYHRLEENSRHDGLTKVFNRAHLNDCLEKQFQHSTLTQEPMTVGFIDLDHFKQVNDTYGHAAGDHILKGVADILSSQLRSGDVIGRYGGEEFVIILPGIKEKGAQIAFDRILASINSAHFDVGIHAPIKVTASIGFATHSPTTPFNNLAHLVNTADKALYEAKANGRNCNYCLALEFIS